MKCHTWSSIFKYFLQARIIFGLEHSVWVERPQYYEKFKMESIVTAIIQDSIQSSHSDAHIKIYDHLLKIDTLENCEKFAESWSKAILENQIFGNKTEPPPKKFASDVVEELVKTMRLKLEFLRDNTRSRARGQEANDLAKELIQLNNKYKSIQRAEISLSPPNNNDFESTENFRIHNIIKFRNVMRVSE